MKKVHLLDGQNFKMTGRRPLKHARDRVLGWSYRRYWRHWRRDKNPFESGSSKPSKSGRPRPRFCCAERHL